MRANDYFQNVVSSVCRHTGIDEARIYNSNKEACVDARYILVHLLSQKFTDEEIASFTGLSRTCANKIRNSFRYKLKKFSVRCTMEDICREVNAMK